MNSTLIGIISAICLLAGIGLTGFVLGKIMRKSALKKYKREFSLMCYAVAAEISKNCGCDIKGLRGQIDSYIDMCAKYDDIPKDPGVREYYKLKDYRRFTCLSALKYESQFINDEEHQKVKEYCSFQMPDFSNCSFHDSYDSRSDLNRVPKNNSYLIAFYCWVIGIPFCRLVYAIGQLIVLLVKRIFLR